MTKICGTCGVEKPLADFYVSQNSNGSRSRRKHCGACINVRQREQRQTKRKGRPSLPTNIELADWYSAGCPL